MRAFRHQHADKRDNVQRYKKENRWRQDREEFFLELFEYFVHGTPLFTEDFITKIDSVPSRM
jgi:hypothetical protein